MKITNRGAVEARQALGILTSINLPIKTSLEIARLAYTVEKQVAACAKVRDTLIKNYKIKIGVGDGEGTVTFSTTVTGENEEETKRLKMEAVTEFVAKVNELMEMDTEDIQEKFHLPENINIAPDTLKPLVPFIEMAI